MLVDSGFLGFQEVPYFWKRATRDLLVSAEKCVVKECIKSHNDGEYSGNKL